MRSICTVLAACAALSACAPMPSHYAAMASPTPTPGAASGAYSPNAPSQAGKMSPAGAKLLADTEAFRAKCGAKLAAKTASAGTQMGQVSMMAGIASMATGGVASQAIGAGDVDFAVGCGVENMTRVPMLFDLTLGKGDFKGFDDLHPAIARRFPIPHQVESAELIAERWGISRGECDAFAVESHRRAHACCQPMANSCWMRAVGDEV